MASDGLADMLEQQQLRGEILELATRIASEHDSRTSDAYLFQLPTWCSENIPWTNLWELFQALQAILIHMSREDSSCPSESAPRAGSGVARRSVSSECVFAVFVSATAFAGGSSSRRSRQLRTWAVVRVAAETSDQICCSIFAFRLTNLSNFDEVFALWT